MGQEQEGTFAVPPLPQPEEQALLWGIVENPRDDTRLLVLADWLEEKDPCRAELLRLHLSLLATCCEPDKYPDRAAQQARLVKLLGVGVSPSVPRQTVALAEGVEMTFAWIPPGSFLMGSPFCEAYPFDYWWHDEDEYDESQHTVTLSRGFFLGITPVTQAQWWAVMGKNPSRFRSAGRPVECVSWDNCQAFCTRLGQLTGKRFRLPTEAEWEYAGRAGTTTPFWFGETVIATQVNCDRQGRDFPAQTTPVSDFPPNAWGLFDMHGNVWEWCADWYGAYRREEVTDPQGEAYGDGRVLRGGSWDAERLNCRSACRVRSDPTVLHVNVGCRVCLG